jgi:hypothetical protein
MKKQTFVEVFLVKYGQISQEEVEVTVSHFVELFPNNKTPDKSIMGVLGYIKYAQKNDSSNEDIAAYILKDMHNSMSEKMTGKECVPSTQSFWVEMDNEKMPKL